MRLWHLFVPYKPAELLAEQLEKAEIALLEVTHKSEYYRHMTQMLELRVQRLRRTSNGSFDRPPVKMPSTALQVDNERID
jgi:hypothetical protein